VNIARTAIEALAGVLGGTQSLHTNSMDEALALPSEKAARIALRTQQVLAHETNVTNVADPLGGSYFVEALTDEMASEAEAIFAEILAMGKGSMLEGCVKGIEENWFQGRIAESAYKLERSFNDGQRIIVGVNDFTEGNDDADLEILRITNEDERKQIGRLNDVRASRDDEKVLVALEELTKDAEDPEVNLMPALINAAKANVTVGEMMGAMEKVFGRHVEVPSL
jgi:methylmalonyl-CoA mutase, N-terminal domain